MEPDYECFYEGDAAEEAGDYARALACFEQGTRLGGSLCWARLAFLYDYGNGVPLDKARAKDCWLKAWRRGDNTAAFNIAITCRQLGDRRGSVRWFRKAAAAGNVDAHIELAKLCIRGEGLRRSKVSAAQFLQAALVQPWVQPDEAKQVKAMLTRLRASR